MSIDSYEYVLSRSPFVVRRRVRWSDCDPAGVVYTGKFTEYVLGFVNLFYSELASEQDYLKWRQSMGVDTPCKGMEYEFHGALWPDDVFDMRCHVSQLREHSYDIQIESTQPDGRRIFSARFSPICIRRDARVRAPLPPQLRDALSRFMRPSV